MTREEAINEINEVFTPAYANYIVTALTEGATVSDKEPTTKNDLGVDCINRQAAITFVCKNIKEILKDTTPLEVKLSDDYIYENVAKIMRNPKVLHSVTPQESKPMVEIDLYSVIKQKYIEREVLDEIKAEIDGLTYYWYEVHPRDVINDVFEIIDKHKAESEEEK